MGPPSPFVLTWAPHYCFQSRLPGNSAGPGSLLKPLAPQGLSCGSAASDVPCGPCPPREAPQGPWLPEGSVPHPLPFHVHASAQKPPGAPYSACTCGRGSSGLRPHSTRSSLPFPFAPCWPAAVRLPASVSRPVSAPCSAHSPPSLERLENSPPTPERQTDTSRRHFREKRFIGFRAGCRWLLRVSSEAAAASRGLSLSSEPLRPSDPVLALQC